MPRFLAARPNSELITLPWGTPLADWPEENLVALPRGISRHVVRFVRVAKEIYAFKEVIEHLALHEYELLRDLARLDTPSVEAVGVVTARVDEQGEPLDPILITRHLQFSLPYRSLFSRGVRQDTVNRLVDAMVVLLVQLHLNGLLWGDVSLSNTLFRRDAGAFAAYLVDAETGELYPDLSTGQREYDLEIARVNIAGELMDLLDGGLIEEKVDPVATSELIMDSYRRLWTELTAKESFEIGERWRVAARIRRLNELGFDVEEYAMKTTQNGSTIQLQPKVVDAGHHMRRLLRLTGLDAQENQARRLLNDMDTFRADNNPGVDEEYRAHRWVSQIFEPIVRSIPRDLFGKLEPSEAVHEILEHRWYMSEKENRHIPLAEAVQSYIDSELRHRRDEAAIMLNPDTELLKILEVETEDSRYGDDETSDEEA